MEQAGRVSFCVLVDQGRALLVHRHAGRRLFPDVWDLPGGHVEPGEAPDETARREVAEEVGVTVVDLELVDVPVDAPGAVTHVYLALSWHGDPANAAPHEHDQIGWFTPAEAELLRPRWRRSSVRRWPRLPEPPPRPPGDVESPVAGFVPQT